MRDVLLPHMAARRRAQCTQGVRVHGLEGQVFNDAALPGSTDDHTSANCIHLQSHIIPYTDQTFAYLIHLLPAVTLFGFLTPLHYPNDSFRFGSRFPIYVISYKSIARQPALGRGDYTLHFFCSLFFLRTHLVAFHKTNKLVLLNCC